MTTEAQINANRKNAQLSTGAQDTSQTRFNAVKHGILSKHLVSKEEKEELEILFQELIDDFQPKTKIELRIVEKAASALWDSQRIYKKESVFEHNKSIEERMEELEKAIFEFDSSTILDKEEHEKLKNKIMRLIMFEESFSRYKLDSDNRFYKALRMLRK
tara:strand:+ start:898 stop:1377 length:480 start_codon:yes stop_codon:yes gene_type:complete